jgi:hypothetical protein
MKLAFTYISMKTVEYAVVAVYYVSKPHNLYVTSTLQPVYINNVTDIHSKQIKTCIWM